VLTEDNEGNEEDIAASENLVLRRADWPGSVLDNVLSRAENQAMKSATNCEWRMVK
jgi:hypothetical protein